jgi:hypothetical protein
MALAAAVLVAGCAGGRQLLAQAQNPGDVDWRRVATPQDRIRLREWRTAWVAALAMMDDPSSRATIARDPAFYDPDRVLNDTALDAGLYRCRVVKLGGRDPASAAMVTRGSAQCRVAREGERTMLSIDGVQRYHGYIFAGDETRQVFLGTIALGDETRALRYGRDARRDAAGFIQRIGPRRWRLVMPYPGFESTLDVVDIVPAG